MGCDGGTIPRRDELVRTKKKPEQKDKDAETVAKWKHCALTQQALAPPIVACELGRLYNKDSVIEFLLSKDTTKEIAKHIRSLKDITELKLTVNAGYQDKGAEKGDEYIDVQASQFICPVVGLEMNGRYKFCYLHGCGCVFSERAFKEVNSSTCHKCGKPFSKEDITVINGTDEEVAELETKMNERRMQAKLDKKNKKHKSSASEITSTESVPPEKVAKLEAKPGTSGLQNKNGLGSSKVSVASKLALPRKASSDYSIAKDPKASEAYKSLFTSHKTATNQQKAHWITHNPLYY